MINPEKPPFNEPLTDRVSQQLERHASDLLDGSGTSTKQQLLDHWSVREEVQKAIRGDSW